jgi:hypothetical protein
MRGARLANLSPVSMLKVCALSMPAFLITDITEQLRISAFATVAHRRTAMEITLWQASYLRITTRLL